jgi:amino acid transporter
MKKIFYLILTFLVNLFYTPVVLAQTESSLPTVDVGFNTSNFNLATILSFLVRLFFTIAALAALLYLLLGAFSWITSGGEKEKVSKAQEKIQAAVIGVVLIVGVLAIVVTLEQLVFRNAICFGITCPIKIPGLIQPGP